MGKSTACKHNKLLVIHRILQDSAMELKVDLVEADSSKFWIL